MTMVSIEGIDYEMREDGVVIEQSDQCGNPVDSVFLHKIVLAHLATEAGLLDTSAGDAALQRENSALRRRLRVAAQRVTDLERMLLHCGDHEPLEDEQALCSATADLLNEWCRDLDESPVEAHGRKRITPAQPTGVIAPATTDAIVAAPSAPESGAHRPPTTPNPTQLSLEA